MSLTLVLGGLPSEALGVHPAEGARGFADVDYSTYLSEI